MTQATPSSSQAVGDKQHQSLAGPATPSREAFARHYALLAPRLFRYFWIQTRSRSLAEDLVSETFLEALGSLATYRADRGAFSAWLFAIGRRVLARNAAELAQAPLSGAGLEAVVTMPVHSGRPSADERIDLWQAVRRLSGRERDIIALKFGGDLMHREIAETTGMSETNVGVVVYRALQKLRALLADEGKDDAP